MSGNTQGNILIFDIEGADSAERKEQKVTFEQTTSLFALVVSDVLLINMWATDVGKHTAGGREILKVIFECNLKLFKQNGQKKLLFVFRDFDPDEISEDKTKNTMRSALEEIWVEIYKPDGFKDAKIADFFDLDYFFLPHKKWAKAQFESGAGQLRQMIESGSMFLPIEGDPNDLVPIDGLGFFLQ